MQTSNQPATYAVGCTDTRTYTYIDSDTYKSRSHCTLVSPDMQWEGTTINAYTVRFAWNANKRSIVQAHRNAFAPTVRRRHPPKTKYASFPPSRLAFQSLSHNNRNNMHAHTETMWSPLRRVMLDSEKSFESFAFGLLLQQTWKVAVSTKQHTRHLDRQIMSILNCSECPPERLTGPRCFVRGPSALAANIHRQAAADRHRASWNANASVASFGRAALRTLRCANVRMVVDAIVVVVGQRTLLVSSWYAFAFVRCSFSCWSAVPTMCTRKSHCSADIQTGISNFIYNMYSTMVCAVWWRWVTVNVCILWCMVLMDTKYLCGVNYSGDIIFAKMTILYSIL